MGTPGVSNCSAICLTPGVIYNNFTCALLVCRSFTETCLTSGTKNSQNEVGYQVCIIAPLQHGGVYGICPLG